MDDHAARINVPFELELQDLRHILHTALRIGNLVDIVLERVLPGAIALWLVLWGLDSKFTGDVFFLVFFAAALPLGREFLVRGQLSALAARGMHRMRLSASEAWLEIEHAGTRERYTWEQVVSLRWTPTLLLLEIAGAKTNFVPRRVITETTARFLRKHARTNLEGAPRMVIDTKQILAPLSMLLGFIVLFALDLQEPLFRWFMELALWLESGR